MAIELSTDRLEGTSRMQDRPLSPAAEERKRRTRRRSKDETGVAEPEDLAEEEGLAEDEKDSHQLDDIA